MDLEVHPYESASAIVDRGQSWGVIDCVCRKQKALIGDPCDHPIDVCLMVHTRPFVYDDHPAIKALTHDEAITTLQRSAEAGLVHSVSNSQRGLHLHLQLLYLFLRHFTRHRRDGDRQCGGPFCLR